MKYIHPRRFFHRLRHSCCENGGWLHDFFFYYLIPDRWEIKYRFKKKLGYKCSLRNPQTFNEKIQWLKLNDRKPLYPKLTDKLLVKEFVAKELGEEYVIPTLAGGFSHFDDIPFEDLPNQFVLKCNHDSSSTVICKDKKTFDFELARQKIEKALRRNYYHSNGKQWSYKDIAPRVFVEKYMDEGTGELRDYKFMMFNGECKSIFFFVDRFPKNGLKMNCYDSSWNLLPFTRGNPNTNYEVPKPKELELMLDVAHRLAALVDNPFVRVDLYDIRGKVYFGEYTFYPGGGYDAFEPQEWDLTFGNWIDLKR